MKKTDNVWNLHNVGRNACKGSLIDFLEVCYLAMLASVLRATKSPASSSFCPATHETSTGNLAISATTSEPTHGWVLLTRSFISPSRMLTQPAKYKTE